jgi:hypothetical protein
MPKKQWIYDNVLYINTDGDNSWDTFYLKYGGVVEYNVQCCGVNLPRGVWVFKDVELYGIMLDKLDEYLYD